MVGSNLKYDIVKIFKFFENASITRGEIGEQLVPPFWNPLDVFYTINGISPIGFGPGPNFGKLGSRLKVRPQGDFLTSDT